MQQIFYSALHEIKNSTHVMAWALDIVVGLFLGISFQYLWGKYNVAARLSQETEFKPIPNKVRNYFKAKVWLGLNFAYLFALLSMFLWGASSLLSQGLWLNPGPIAIGMFIDSLLSSRAESGSHLSGGFSHLLKEHPDMIWQAAFVGYVVVFKLLLAYH